MIINHYCNSFLSVEVNGKKIVCDPWIGATNESAWYSYPFFNQTSFLNEIKPDFIYISHLHCDHFDPKTLLDYNNKKTQIIIKEFKNKRLKDKISELGYKNIIEIKEWRKTKISNDFNIAIVPQMSSNSSDLDDEVSYDLDTSIIIQSRINKKIFYNNVDNPLSTNNLIELNKFIKNSFKGALSAFCYPLGAASGYPQTYLSVNKVSEKNRIINTSLNKVRGILKIFNPEVYFPAGGTYLISGKFHLLNKWIAQPNNNQIVKFFKDTPYKVVNIEGGGYINLDNNNIEYKEIDSNLDTLKKEIGLKLSKIKYFYQYKEFEKSINLIDRLFDECQEKYIERIKKLNIKKNWNIQVSIYKNLILNNNGKIDGNKSGFLKTYLIKNSYSYHSKNIDLTCHLDKKLFYNLMLRGSPWNTALTGSIIMFHRKSKTYSPTTENSLNFFTK